MTKDDITRREARRMVEMGMYDTVAQAWSEAIALCDESDAYEALQLEEDEESRKYYDDEDE